MEKLSRKLTVSVLDSGQVSKIESKGDCNIDYICTWTLTTFLTGVKTKRAAATKKYEFYRRLKLWQQNYIMQMKDFFSNFYYNQI